MAKRRITTPPLVAAFYLHPLCRAGFFQHTTMLGLIHSISVQWCRRHKIIAPAGANTMPVVSIMSCAPEFKLPPVIALLLLAFTYLMEKISPAEKQRVVLIAPSAANAIPSKGYA